MSITVPSTLTPPELGDFYSGQQIEDGDWDTLLQSLHYVWSRRGARVTGKLFNPPFETTSTTSSPAVTTTPTARCDSTIAPRPRCMPSPQTPYARLASRAGTLS